MHFHHNIKLDSTNNPFFFSSLISYYYYYNRAQIQHHYKMKHDAAPYSSWGSTPRGWPPAGRWRTPASCLPHANHRPPPRRGRRIPPFNRLLVEDGSPRSPVRFLEKARRAGITPAQAPPASGRRGRVEVGPTGQARAPPVQGIKSRRSWLRLRVDATEARRRWGSPAAREEEEGKFGPLYGLDDGLRFYLVQWYRLISLFF